MSDSKVNEMKEDLRDNILYDTPQAEKLVLSTTDGKELKITVMENGIEHDYRLDMNDILIRLPWHYCDTKKGMRRPTLSVHFNDIISQSLMKIVSGLGFITDGTYQDYLKLVGIPLSHDEVEEIRKNPTIYASQDHITDVKDQLKKNLAIKFIENLF